MAISSFFPVLPNLVTETVETKGAEYQINIGYGANFNDKIYVGANIGFTTLNYRNKRIYRETRDDQVLDEFTLEENIEIEGGGVNGTFGIIARPIDRITIGFSFLTPTFYTLEDSYDAALVCTV